MAINSHAHFRLLQRLDESRGKVVEYAEAVRAIKPKGTPLDSAAKITVAPPEAKEAVTHIRKAFKQADCPYRIEAVRYQGYRLSSTFALFRRPG